MFVTSSDDSVFNFNKFQVSLVSISMTVRKLRYNHKSSPLIGSRQFRASLVEVNGDINNFRKSRG